MRELLQDPFLARTSDEPDRLFAKLYFARRPPLTVTHGEFLRRSLEFRAQYFEQGIASGEVVVILLDHGLDLLSAFMGALLHGAVPSIFAPPSLKTPAARYRQTLWESLGVCRPKAVVTDEKIFATLTEGEKPAGIAFIQPMPSRAIAQTSVPSPTSAHAIAFLQHSSGTTGLKKGVALSHRAVRLQIEEYGRAINLRPTDKIISWLPLYHDMGLIATFLQTLVSGVPLLLMSPFDWIADPASLLEKISEERATLCWQPNFAFTLLAERISSKRTENLDLGSMRAFINCSEPISARTHEKFLERFATNGIRGRHLQTCYAMAENTFAVTQSGLGQPAVTDRIDPLRFARQNLAVPVAAGEEFGKTLVSSGRVLPGHEIRVTGIDGQNVGEREVGEILVRSPSMLTEYYRRPDLTAEALSDGWYRTGDLGYLANGELFVTGRKKDLIIVAGKNIYPSDIEDLVSQIDGVYPGRVVAFGEFRERLGTEAIIILAETLRQSAEDQARIAADIRGRLSEIEITAGEIAFRPHGWLLKSSSGKLSRSANRDKYQREKEIA